MEVGDVQIAPSERLSVDPQQRHLPRLSPPRYRGLAVVAWTLGIEARATGWLEPIFHSVFRELLLHASIRESLLCPCYCLMPDHLHWVWMGMRRSSDQRNAVRFLKTHLNRALANSRRGWRDVCEERSESHAPRWRLRRQAYDHVLREVERRQDAFARVCFYVINNPVRACLAASANDYEFSGALVPGYPALQPCQPDYWNVFWRLYERHVEKASVEKATHEDPKAARESAP